MAATAENVTNMINTFKKVFKDVAEFRWIDGDVSTANLATTKWDKELPILTDGMDFNQAEPSSTSVKVLGVDKDWASMHEAGTVTMKIQLPTIADGILGWLYKVGAATVATGEELLNGESGSFTGKGYSLIEEMPLGEVGRSRGESFCSSDQVRALIGARYTLLDSPEQSGGPARYVRLKEFPDSRIGFISPHSHNFCSTCNRVRLTVEDGRQEPDGTGKMIITNGIMQLFIWMVFLI